MILVINTISQQPFVALHDQVVELEADLVKQNLIEKVDGLLKSNNLEIKDIEKVAVAVGSGSFSAQRAAVAVANTFQFTNNVKLLGYQPGDMPIQEQIDKVKNDKFSDQLINPDYDREPNITSSNSKT